MRTKTIVSYRVTDTFLARLHATAATLYGISTGNLHIRYLAHVDQRFNELCSDYADALGLYRYWKDKHGADASARAQDYRTALSELEAEISRALDATVRARD